MPPVDPPHLDALGRDGLVFRNAWSHCPLTLPSHLSMVTGLLPPAHQPARGRRRTLRYGTGVRGIGGAAPPI